MITDTANEVKKIMKQHTWKVKTDSNLVKDMNKIVRLSEKRHSISDNTNYLDCLYMYVSI